MPPEYVSPWIAQVRDCDEGGAASAVGIYHRLTGRAFSLASALVDPLLDAGAECLSPDDLDRDDLPVPLRALLGELRDDHFIVDSPSGLAGLRDLHDHLLTLPLRNPAVILDHPTQGLAVVYRPERLSVCELPRIDRRPAIVREVLDPCARAIINLASAHVTLGRAEARLYQVGFDSGQIERALQFLTDPERQLIRLAAPGDKLDAPNAPFQFLVQSFVRTTQRQSLEGKRAISAGTYYADAIPDAQANFDWLEPTVSHAFRRASAALGGRCYGERLFDGLRPWLEKQIARSGELDILEIGGGLGHVAQAFLDAACAALNESDLINYTILDLSSELQAAQKASLRCHAANVQFLIGDAQHGLGAERRYDLIMANEVIADLDVSDQELDANPSATGLVQSGIAKLIANIANGLKEGGRAVLIEYGSQTNAPERVTHLNHPEFAVNFAAAAKVASTYGLGAAITTLKGFLQVRADAMLLIAQQERCRCLRRLASEFGREIEFRSYDREEFEAEFAEILTGWKLVSPMFAPQSAGLHFGPDIDQFFALTLDQT